MHTIRWFPLLGAAMMFGGMPGTAAFAHDPAPTSHEARASIAPTGPATVVVEGVQRSSMAIDDALFASLPKSTTVFDDHGTKVTLEGVDLAQVLEQAGAPLGAAMRGDNLAYVVIVEARDGYRAVFALAELDAAIGGKSVTLARTRDGKPLSSAEGPYRLAVSGDGRAARSVRQIAAIRVVKVR